MMMQFNIVFLFTRFVKAILPECFGFFLFPPKNNGSAQKSCRIRRRNALFRDTAVFYAFTLFFGADSSFDPTEPLPCGRTSANV